MASAKDLARRLTEITMTDLDDKDRQLLIRESRRLHHRLMAPAERVPTMMWTEPWTLVAVKVAMDMELFAVLERGPLSSEQAAGTIGADPLLVGRICRLLGTQDIIEEVDVDTFINTEFSKSLADPKSVRNGFEHFYDVGIPQLEHTPDYLRRTKWQAPDDTADAPFGHLMGMSTERLGYWVSPSIAMIKYLDPHQLTSCAGLAPEASPSVRAFQSLSGLSSWLKTPGLVPILSLSGAIAHGLRQIEAACR